ncbi:hypothetical protein ACFV0C_36870 [Streptomyces sp. NPDC059568]|uniref:zinc finger domain-containing protein n=1 Tax=Streptomyces sp. NPDC059568 TaxID=3346868 RepID=UPI0036A6426A
MTPQEAILIAKYVSSLCPQQRFNEHTPDVWGDVLGPYDVNDARAAVVAVASRQPFIAPAEIIREIKERRAERIALANPVYDGNPNETGAESGQSMRALIRAAADGQTPPQAIAASVGHGRPKLTSGTPTTGRAAAVLASVGKAVPRVRKGVVNPRGIACRACHALPGASCTARGRRMADAHPARLEDARRAAAGLPPVDPADDAREIERRRAASATHAITTPAITYEDAT